MNDNDVKKPSIHATHSQQSLYVGTE